jgi:hypothetical protein
MNDLHETTELTEQLNNLPIVRWVSYEFPGVWHICLNTNEVFFLGDANNLWGWNDEAGNAGETKATEAKQIASDFEKWVKGLNA